MLLTLLIQLSEVCMILHETFRIKFKPG